MQFPNSIREINSLADDAKHTIYATLLPDWLFTQFGINRDTLTVDGLPAVEFRCPVGTRAFEMTVKSHPNDIDPILYVNIADTFTNQLLVLLVIVNDLNSPRFDVDVDETGKSTHLGTSGRNVKAELAAMGAGLSPGQIRRGLRSFKQSVPHFEQFVSQMGHDLFFIEPLAYHNAIIFERYGFNYMYGHKEMLNINEGFQVGGEFREKLTVDNPFRIPEAWKTVRGRSWAIHDGILGRPFTGFQMYKRIGIHAGINTFPNSEW